MSHKTEMVLIVCLKDTILNNYILKLDLLLRFCMYILMVA